MLNPRLLLISALAALVAGCHTAAGGGPPAPSPSPPSVVKTVTSGISANAGLYQAANAPDGRIWFSEFGTSGVAAVTTAGVVTEYPMLANSQPNAIVAGPDGNIWTGGYGGQIFKVTTSGTATAYPIAGAHIGGMAVGPDNNVWFTDYGNDAVGRITVAGAVTEYKAPLGAIPSEIAKGSDGNLWVTDSNGSILRVTVAGVFAQYNTGLTSGAKPQAIVAASDGNLYFTEPFFSSSQNDRIGKIAVNGAIIELGTLAPNTYPNQITTGKDGNLYFTEFGAGGNLGKVTLGTGKISETPLGITSGGGIVNGPDGNLWVGSSQTIYVISY